MEFNINLDLLSKTEQAELKELLKRESQRKKSVPVDGDEVFILNADGTTTQGIYVRENHELYRRVNSVYKDLEEARREYRKRVILTQVKPFTISKGYDGELYTITCDSRGKLHVTQCTGTMPPTELLFEDAKTANEILNTYNGSLLETFFHRDLLQEDE